MKLENQVCNLELAKKLKELGVKQESVRWWLEWYNIYKPGHYGEKEYKKKNRVYLTDRQEEQPLGAGLYNCSAYTVAELGEMLKGYISLRETYAAKIGWRIHAEKYAHFCTADTEANARAKMRIWLIEQGKVKL